MSDIVKRLAKCAAVSEIIKDNPKLYYDAAHEIERLRAENEKLRNEVMSDYNEGFEEGIKAERERCAKIAERYLSNNEPVRLTASSIAAEIRESGE